MQEKILALIHLKLGLVVYGSRPALALPGGFLGESFPCLQSLRSPALLKPFFTADLIHISLRNIPHFGYIATEAIVTGLAELADLKRLTIKFESPLSCSDQKADVHRRQLASPCPLSLVSSSKLSALLILFHQHFVASCLASHYPLCSLFDSRDISHSISVNFTVI
jgi:hypothetical protein